MKKFLITTIVFFVGVILINIYFYSIVNEVLYKPYEIEPKNVEKYSSFLLADSHGKSVNQVDLDKLSIYNLSFNSDSYIDIYIKLNYLLDKNIKVKNLYITADEHTMSPYREKGNNNSRSVFLTDYKIYRELFDKNIICYYNETFFMKYFTVINTNNSKLIKEFLFSKKESQNDEDENFSQLTPKERIEKANKRISLQFVGNTTSLKMKKYLNKIFELCKKNDVKVYGVKFPLSKDYLISMSNKSYRADSVFSENNIKILDFKNIFIENDNLFQNQDHLNDKGSKQFSIALKNKLK